MKSTNTAILAAAFLGLASASGETTGETALRGRELFVCGEGGNFNPFCEREGRFFNYYVPCCECEPFYTGGRCNQCTDEVPNQQPVLDQSELEQQEYACDQVVDSEGNYQGPLILGSADAGNLPENLQGIFWLTDQKDSSSIVSFGAPGQSMDGGDLNPGYLTECKTSISVRVGGDRNWGFHDTTTNWNLVEGLDLVYQFQFDNIQDPQHCTIIPTGRNLGGFEMPSWALRFDMDLIPERCIEGGDNLDGCEEIKPARWAGIPAWSRPSYAFGFEIDSALYQLVQVVDGHGKATAAMDEWVQYCNDDVTGSSPNKMFYRKAKDAPFIGRQ